MKRSEMMGVIASLRQLPPEARRRVFGTLPACARAAVLEEWWWQTHGGQLEPGPCAGGLSWRVWAIVAGRGFGKTRAGAEWVWTRARQTPQARIALVAASLDEVAKVMVEGESGLLGCARSGERPRWLSSRGILRFPSGAEAFAYSAERPGQLRGPQHNFAWCDELAKWPASPAFARAGFGSGQARGDGVWDNLMLGLRLGERPRTIVTTTPQPVPLLKRILALPRCAATRGRTDQNPHLPADFREAVTQMYGGTRLGLQELDGLLFDDIEGALWTREMIEAARVPPVIARGRDDGMTRIVVGVDPPCSTNGDACGIVVCGLGADPSTGSGQAIAFVLADHSVQGLRPEGWARRVAAAAEMWGAQRVVAEKNQGGDMVESVLRAADSALPVKLVAATKAKAARAEPIALRFETGQAKLAGRFPELEDELCAITYAGYEGPTNSPDRADAMVWAMSELFEKRAEPRVRLL